MKSLFFWFKKLIIVNIIIECQYMCLWISYYFGNVVVLIIFGLILRSTTKCVTENGNKTIFSNIFINTYFCRTKKLFLSCFRIGFTRPSYLNDDRTTKHLYTQFIRYSSRRGFFYKYMFISLWVDNNKGLRKKSLNKRTIRKSCKKDCSPRY